MLRVILTLLLCSVTFARDPIHERPRPFVFVVHQTEQLDAMTPEMLARLKADEFGVIVLFGRFYRSEVAGEPVPHTGYEWVDAEKVQAFRQAAHAEGFRVVQYAQPGKMAATMTRYGAIGFILLGGTTDGWFFDGLAFSDGHLSSEIVRDYQLIRQVRPNDILIGHDDVPSRSLWYVCGSGPWRSLLDYHLVGEVWAKPDSDVCQGCPAIFGPDDPQLDRWLRDPVSIGLFKVELRNRCEPWGVTDERLCEFARILPKHGAGLWVSLQNAPLLKAHEECLLPVWRQR